jgi:hypothetical protein
VSLGGYTVELVNGTGGGAAVYQTVPLPVVDLADGDYFVICSNAATTVNCDLDVDPDTDLIQNGSPDAVALRDATGALVDTVSYEGDTGAPYTEGSGVTRDDRDRHTASVLTVSTAASTTSTCRADATAWPAQPGLTRLCADPGG